VGSSVVGKTFIRGLAKKCTAVKHIYVIFLNFCMGPLAYILCGVESNLEIVSCRLCVRSVWLPSEIQGRFWLWALSLSPFAFSLSPSAFRLSPFYLVCLVGPLKSSVMGQNISEVPGKNMSHIQTHVCELVYFCMGSLASILCGG
jgi:hypothetical protein